MVFSGFKDCERVHLDKRNTGILGAEPTLARQELRQVKIFQIVMLWLLDDAAPAVAHDNRDELQDHQHKALSEALLMTSSEIMPSHVRGPRREMPQSALDPVP